MMDGSLKEDGKTPSTYEYNVAITSEVARLAHMVGASVEGELGCLGSLETGHGEAEDGRGFDRRRAGPLQDLLTRPGRGDVLSSRPTEVDALGAVAPTGDLARRLDRAHSTRKPASRRAGDGTVIAEIDAKLPKTDTRSLHGSS